MGTVKVWGEEGVDAGKGKENRQNRPFPWKIMAIEILKSLNLYFLVRS